MLQNKLNEYFNFFTDQYEIINKYNSSMAEIVSSLISSIAELNEEIVSGFKNINGSNFLQIIAGQELTLFQNKISELSDFITVLRGEESYLLENSTVFTVVLYGKVNSGKSFMGNFLCGRKIKGVNIPDSTFQALGKTGSILSVADFAVKAIECTKAVQWCQIGALKIVDLPGLDSVDSTAHKTAYDFIANSDLVINLTNSDAPLRSSDYKNIIDLLERRKKIIVVISQCDKKKDILSKKRISMEQEDIDDQVAYVREQLDLLSANESILDIIPVSVMLARQGLDELDKSENEEAAISFEQSNMEFLLTAIIETIKEQGLKIKLEASASTWELNAANAGSFSENVLQITSLIKEKINQYTTLLNKVLSETLEDTMFDYFYIKDFLITRKSNIDLFSDKVFSLFKLGETFLNNLVMGKQSNINKIKRQFEKQVLNFRQLRDVFEDVINEKTVPRIETGMDTLYQRYAFRTSMRHVHIKQDLIDTVIEDSITNAIDTITTFISKSIQKFIVQNLSKRLATSRLKSLIPYLAPVSITSDVISVKQDIDKHKAELNKQLMQTFDDIESQVHEEYKKMVKILIEDARKKIMNKHINPVLEEINTVEGKILDNIKSQKEIQTRINNLLY